MTPPDPARAARLTAIAELERFAEQLRCRYGDEHYCPNCDNSMPTASECLAAAQPLLAHVETLTQQVAELEADRDSWRELRNTLALPALARAEQAEQQRDAAHAALLLFHNAILYWQDLIVARDSVTGQDAEEILADFASIDAALAASAPQKEK